MSDDSEIKLKGIYAENVLDFVRSANEYCAWLEEVKAEEAKSFIKDAIRKLSLVYARAVDLEDIEPVMEGGNEKFVSEQDWSAIFENVLQILGPHNSYLRIAEGEEYDRSDLVPHKISEDMADIYQDLKDFVFQYRQGIEEIMNDALWEVMDNFDNYWSEKLLYALQALNKLYIKKIIPGEEQEENPMSETDDTPGYDTSFFTRLQDLNEEEI